MKKIILATSVALLAFMIGANTASAQITEYATGVESYTPGYVKGGGTIPAPRDDASRALGAPNGEFVSLGYGGELVVSFDTLMSGPLSISVQEITGGNSYPEELAEVWVSPDNSAWTLAGTASNEEAQGDGLTTFDLGEMCVKYVKVIDVTDDSIHSNGTDGFDVDAVIGDYQSECQPEPEPEPKPSHDIVFNSNEGIVLNGVVAHSNTGGNRAGGSEAGDGGRGGDIDNSSRGDVEDSSTGAGGRGGNSSAGGYINTGDASAEAGAINLVNSNTTRINRCACDDAQEGHVLVVNSNRGGVGNFIMSDANTGYNGARGSYAGDGGRGGDIANHDGEGNKPPRKNEGGSEIEDSNTGRGGAGGNSGIGAAIFTGDATSRALALNALNRNDTRILR